MTVSVSDVFYIKHPEYLVSADERSVCCDVTAALQLQLLSYLSLFTGPALLLRGFSCSPTEPLVLTLFSQNDVSPQIKLKQSPFFLVSGVLLCCVSLLSWLWSRTDRRTTRTIDRHHDFKLQQDATVKRRFVFIILFRSQDFNSHQSSVTDTNSPLWQEAAVHRNQNLSTSEQVLPIWNSPRRPVSPLTLTLTLTLTLSPPLHLHHTKAGADSLEQQISAPTDQHLSWTGPQNRIRLTHQQQLHISNMFWVYSWGWNNTSSLVVLWVFLCVWRFELNLKSQMLIRTQRPHLVMPWPCFIIPFRGKGITVCSKDFQQSLCVSREALDGI